MAKNDWYTINRNGYNKYLCVVVDKNYEFQRQYHIVAGVRRGTWMCDCQAVQSDCRHIKMLRWFFKHGKVNTRVYYSFDKHEWMQLHHDQERNDNA